MRDGARLVTDVHLPPEAVEGPVPAVLLRTPYARRLYDVEIPTLLEAGLAVAVQSVRGRHGSDGEFVPYFAERADGYDAVEWVAAQPWCDGNVGMAGASYGGWVQWAAALERPPHLRTLVSAVCCAQWTREWPWRNGVLWPGAITWLHLTSGADDVELGADEVARLNDPPTPLSRFQERYARHVPMADDWLRHPQPDDYWQPITLTAADFARIDLPALHITGWFDGCQLGSQFLYDGMRAHSPARNRQALLVGAWDHTVREPKRHYDTADFGPANVADVQGERARWLRRWLRSERGSAALDGARVFVTGINRWADLPAFPPDEVDNVTLHLGPGTLENAPVASESVHSFRNDPADPVRTATDGIGFPSLDRRRVHERDDVITFVSDPLEQHLGIAGVVNVRLRVSSDAADTDWFVELTDLAQDGHRFLVGYGMQRARFREGRNQPTTPGQAYDVDVSLTPRAHVFTAGHRLCLGVMGTGFPLWAPNPNTAEDVYSGTDLRVAINSVHAGGAAGSRVTLPTTRSLLPTGERAGSPAAAGHG